MTSAKAAEKAEKARIQRWAEYRAQIPADTAQNTKRLTEAMAGVLINTHQ
jgi:hypothetical protein